MTLKTKPKIKAKTGLQAGRGGKGRLPEGPLRGLDILKGIQKRNRAYSPFVELLAMRVLAVEPGAVSISARPDRSHLNINGAVHGGYLVSLLDTAMGCACLSLLEAGEEYTTLELKTSFLRPLLQKQNVRAEATVAKRGSRIVFAEAKVVAGNGDLIAHASCTCLVSRPKG